MPRGATIFLRLAMMAVAVVSINDFSCLVFAEVASTVTPEQMTFFENKVRPLLAGRCWECHNEDLQESGLRLDSLQAMIDGGQRGPAIRPGQAKESLLIHAVNHSEAELQMPEGDKLSAREIKVLTEWVNMGAPWPGQDVTRRAADPQDDGGPLFTEEEKQFWAFVPPRLPSPPKVNNRAWVQSDLDRFILAALEQAGLTPAPSASKRSLIRRAYFDLIGLPPTPAQVDSFLQDDLPGAFERMVDQLLASPRYGERWGRHWLDVARYADSNGLDENVAFEFIYKYRDWVIQSMNEDLPYNDFVTYQIAGDLIERRADETAEAHIHRVKAAGFLSVGPKMVADDDPMKKKMDVIDEQLNTLSRAFMALTVGCARCHDHKFDPIPTWDYYAMASILKSTKTLEHLNVVAPIALHELKPTGYDAAFAIYDKGLKELTAQRDGMLRAAAGEKFDEIAKDEEKADQCIPDDQKVDWEALKRTITAHQKTKPEPERVMAVKDDKPEDLRVMIRGNYLTLGEQTRRQFFRIIDGEQAIPIETEGSGRLELARWLASPQHPLTARVFVNRVWRWRFGRGIVATPDNFGRLGERPTHPGLLDWLAVKFVEEDHWSLKRLHKRMMLSSTYQMSTSYDERAHEIDPMNQYWWRFPRKRLEAEALRDAMLHVSDNLDLQMGGSLMPVKDRAYVTNTAYTEQYNNQRRSVYQPVYRSAVYDVLTILGFPDPATSTGDRKDSVVAPQALLMMNSPLVEQITKGLARLLLKNFETDVERVEALFERAYGRQPRSEEVTAILGHLESPTDWVSSAAPESEPAKGDVADSELDRLIKWRGVCRAVIAANEFLFLD